MIKAIVSTPVRVAIETTLVLQFSGPALSYHAFSVDPNYCENLRSPRFRYLHIKATRYR